MQREDSLLRDDQRAPGRIELSSGPRRAEEGLLSALAAEFAAVRSDPTLLAQPIVVAVPSASLREHIAARVVERAGRAVAGLSILTLHGLALRVLQRAGEPPAPGAALLPLLVRDLARAEPVLRDRLDALDDGYSAVEASVVDLLDAGMDAVHTDGLDERLADWVATGATSEIARAVVRTAGRVSEALDRAGLGNRSHVLRRAADLLEEDPSRLVARAVFVHGFADATGRASDLIAALLRFHAARVLIDEPPDPSTGLPTTAFASHLLGRLEGSGRVETRDLATGEASAADAATTPAVRAPRCIAAPGAEAETRAVAARIAALLRDGISPEAIAVVGRDMAPYATLLRAHFTRLGVPYSGIEPIAAGGAVARKLAALVALLRQKERCPADRWLDAVQGIDGAPLTRVQQADLRLGLRHLGAARLGQLAEVSAAAGQAGGVLLPTRRGLDARAVESTPGLPVDGDEPDIADRPGADSLGAARRWLSGQLLSAACGAAIRALDRLEAGGSARAVDTLESHAERIRALLSQDLCWPSDSPEGEFASGALDALVNDVPQIEVQFDDFTHLLVRGLASGGGEPLGGVGGGVQVLSVMEARARTFDHLFVIGLNRDVFPRRVREDPLLGDSSRRILAELLPDIPIKQRGYDEERHLFAQLMACSEDVTLSWQSAGDDGKVRAPSTLVERLRWTWPEMTAEVAPAPRSAAGLGVPVPAHEHALRFALYAEPDALADVLEVAFDERCLAASRALGSGGSLVNARELAAARLAVVREFDAVPSKGGSLGPYFGFVGPPMDARDPRLARPYVTALEQLARCPWKSFLERTLRIESVPDPIDALPEVDAPMLGSVVHRVLERIARDVLPGAVQDLDAIRLADPAAAALAWPGDPEVFGLLREEASELLAEQGLALAGLVEVLVAQAWPRLECARDLEWPTPDVEIAVAGVEVEGRVRLDARAPADPGSGSADPSTGPQPLDDSIYFRADRVDRVDGELILTDYKTGRPPSQAVRPATRRKHFEATVSRGEQLQAVAYALAVPDGAAVGRYLYLVPGVEGDKLEYRASADDLELRASFERAAGALLAARRAGSFAPRLVEPNGTREPALCSHCDVAEACLRGDSGSRRRLADWAACDASEGAAETALRALWNLAATAGRGVS